MRKIERREKKGTRKGWPKSGKGGREKRGGKEGRRQRHSEGDGERQKESGGKARWERQSARAVISLSFSASALIAGSSLDCGRDSPNARCNLWITCSTRSQLWWHNLHGCSSSCLLVFLLELDLLYFLHSPCVLFIFFHSYFSAQLFDVSVSCSQT